MIVLTCPHCARRLSIPERLRGQKGKCPACQADLDIPVEQPAENRVANQRKRLALAAALRAGVAWSASWAG